MEKQSKNKPYSIKNVTHEHQSSLLSSQRFAIWITTKIGTMPFFYIIFVWTFTWLLWNIFAPKNLQFDESPNFLMWLFISNMIQIFLMPLLLIGQNLQGKNAELLADNDFEVNIKAEKEIAELKKELLEIKQLLKKHLKE
ncbi:DUF1003 domain-containing protein [Flavobacterium sp.]|uniref:DUF1003 domain-containing protein n=1 Tax=Flavobacterium sp. TaxID=239 RepID=UPI0025F52FBE|nr:DUF1003 domain-containing protein [Flavobacterium sp.]